MNRSRLDMNTARDRTPTIPATRRGDGDEGDSADGDSADGEDEDEGAADVAGRTLDGWASVAGVESTAHPLGESGRING